MADNRSVLNLINNVAADPDHVNEISILPLMCGTGKSTAISYKIRETIEQAERTGNGLLIVTDRKDRMDDYMHPHDKDLELYLADHANQITIMSHDNLSEAFRTYMFTPVLMMTTQRFFRLTQEEIERFLQWEKGRRPLILIDERPELTTVVDLDERKLHDCQIAVSSVFANDFCARYEITAAEDSIKAFSKDLNHFFSEDAYCFWSWFTNSESQAEYTDVMDIGFEHICQKREEINSYAGGTYYEDFFTRIRALHHLRSHNALFYHHWIPKNVPLNTFFTLLHNSQALEDLSAKVIVLDGTAELSPEYKLLNCSMHNCSEYLRDLHNLTIHLINLPTSKTDMSSKQHSDYILDCVHSYYDEVVFPDIGADNSRFALFTYKNTENSFKKKFDEQRIEHFGNIVGKNDFRNAKHIIQVGVNRYPDAVYFLYYLALHHGELNYENMQVNGYHTIEVPEILPDECNEEPQFYSEHQEFDAEAILRQSADIKEIMSDHESEVHDIMDRMLLAEIEQNMFRGIIRNSDCEED